MCAEEPTVTNCRQEHTWMALLCLYDISCFTTLKPLHSSPRDPKSWNSANDNKVVCFLILVKQKMVCVWPNNPMKSVCQDLLQPVDFNCTQWCCSKANQFWLVDQSGPRSKLGNVPCHLRLSRGSMSRNEGQLNGHNQPCLLKAFLLSEHGWSLLSFLLELMTTNIANYIIFPYKAKLKFLKNEV